MIQLQVRFQRYRKYFLPLATVAILFACLGFLSAARAESPSGGETLRQRIKREIGKVYPGARIEVNGAIRWTRGPLTETVDAVTFLGDDGRGDAQLVLTGTEGATVEGWVSFAAWVPAQIAIRRILPGEKLNPELFVAQDVNAALGQAHEFRGVILGRGTPIAGLEARQTVLEGQFLLASAVIRSPDVRRGDAVRIHLLSGELSLSTTGTAEESGYLNSALRVMTTKTKRELVGQLSESGIVEVRL